VCATVLLVLAAVLRLLSGRLLVPPPLSPPCSKAVGKGPAVEVFHHLNDEFWHCKSFA